MAAMGKKTCEMIEEHTGLRLLDVDVTEADICGELNCDELYKSVDFNKFSNAELQVVAMICRTVSKEARASHRMDLPHLRELGEKVFERLVQSDISKSSIPAALLKRVPHQRNEFLFTFLHRFFVMRLRPDYPQTMRSPWFRDERFNAIWPVEARPRERRFSQRCQYLSIFLHRWFYGSEHEKVRSAASLMWI